MSELVDASEIRELAAGIERQQVMDIVRGATFVGTLLLGWISLHPFESLGDMQIGDAGTGNELATYAVFGALSVLTVAWRCEMTRGDWRPCCRPRSSCSAPGCWRR